MWHPIAALAVMISKMFGGSLSFDDFMPERPEPKPKQANAQAVGNALRAMANASARQAQINEAKKRMREKKRQERQEKRRRAAERDGAG